MPRAFSENEQKQIRDRLIEVGKRLITAMGIRRLVVEEVAREAGISKGSFYNFFSTREDFILSVFEAWEEEFRGGLLRELAAGKDRPREALETFIIKALEVFERQPGLLRVTPRDIEDLTLRLPPERLAAHQSADRNVLDQAFAEWGASGGLSEDSEAALPALVPLLFIMALHREEFPAGSFGPMARILARALSASLVRADERQE